MVASCKLATTLFQTCNNTFATLQKHYFKHATTLLQMGNNAIVNVQKQ
jgi:hypothetical protein